MTSIAALIVAAGRGERAGGGLPKQYRKVAGRSLVEWSGAAFAEHPDVTAVRFVVGPGQNELFTKSFSRELFTHAPIVGGATRQESVRNGLNALRGDEPDFVLIHDAARPLVSRSVIDGVIAALKQGADAAVPFVPVSDTLRHRGRDGSWTIVPRDNLLRAQTPQGFHYRKIFEAHSGHAATEVTDDMALAELAGLHVAAVLGEESNLKITTQTDFAMAEKLLSGRADIRTGMGYDAHRFTKGDHVWLGGLKIAHDNALEGHSDADAALHALTDAILGALGAGDIGQHFPPSDPRWRGASSDKFLEHAVSLVRKAGGEVVHCDVTIICEAPKIGPHREAMRNRIAEIVAIDVSRVSVKATTTEGMGFTGRKEGLAAQAVATIRF